MPHIVDLFPTVMTWLTNKKSERIALRSLFFKVLKLYHGL